jgi:hypothetical protein
LPFSSFLSPILNEKVPKNQSVFKLSKLLRHNVSKKAILMIDPETMGEKLLRILYP